MSCEVLEVPGLRLKVHPGRFFGGLLLLVLVLLLVLLLLTLLHMLIPPEPIWKVLNISGGCWEEQKVPEDHVTLCLVRFERSQVLD